MNDMTDGVIMDLFFLFFIFYFICGKNILHEICPLMRFLNV